MLKGFYVKDIDELLKIRDKNVPNNLSKNMKNLSLWANAADNKAR